jgi:hypothetical protein
MFSVSFFAMMRADASAAPPGAKPTYIVTVLFGGKSCACAAAASASVANANMRVRLNIIDSFG